MRDVTGITSLGCCGAATATLEGEVADNSWLRTVDNSLSYDAQSASQFARFVTPRGRSTSSFEESVPIFQRDPPEELPPVHHLPWGAPKCALPVGAEPLELPPWLEVEARTRECFELEGYLGSDWPDTGCCLVAVAEKACELPTPVAVPVFSDEASMLARYPNAVHLTRNDATQAINSHNAVQTAMGLLRENLDLVRWVGCLVGRWMEDFDPGNYVLDLGSSLSDCLVDLVTGAYPTHVSYVAYFTNGEGRKVGRGGAAFTFQAPASLDGSVGVTLPLYAGRMNNRVDAFLNGTTEEQLCAIAQIAGTVLHEMTHICVDQPFEHDPEWSCESGGQEAAPCFDMPRMVRSGLMWSFGRRFPCIAIDVGLFGYVATERAANCCALASDEALAFHPGPCVVDCGPEFVFDLPSASASVFREAVPKNEPEVPDFTSGSPRLP